ncbi:hypothetical protein EUGRSUZ_E03059 [Eucalyptus grandis]|uniref:Uncharacterized protein n=2 Tax=Eucalyptus grandis TaxID=71139 RepID=A0ACC3L0T2_EUCGR|nr:hypothetical protein EUGRSUZ_E03059 [Eucalyptus grandis]
MSFLSYTLQHSHAPLSWGEMKMKFLQIQILLLQVLQCGTSKSSMVFSHNSIENLQNVWLYGGEEHQFHMHLLWPRTEENKVTHQRKKTQERC